MSKPTIFFSHSSRDKVALSRLKDAFCAKTGGAIEVFMSSDGQSIPLGRNWVYRVQEGLEGATLMLVFITPNSIGSSWVYFEAGYSYAKNIRVVPIGFLGIDLCQIGAPLNLLQGFNITSSDTLNNLIALVNDEFHHKHSLTFSAEDYVSIIGSESPNAVSPFGKLLEYLEDIGLHLRRNALKAEPEELIGEIDKLLDSASIEYQTGDSFIRMRGVTISVDKGVIPRRLSINADPLAFHATLPILLKIISAIRTDGVRGLPFNFELAPGMDVVQKAHKITAKLYDSEISLRPNGDLVYRNLIFKTGYFHPFMGSSRESAYVQITPDKEQFDPGDAAELLSLLLVSKVIYQSQPELPNFE